MVGPFGISIGRTKSLPSSESPLALGIPFGKSIIPWKGRNPSGIIPYISPLEEPFGKSIERFGQSIRITPYEGPLG
jgi:hypothetical protein